MNATTFLLILHLGLAGYDEPVKGTIEMPSYEVYAQQAAHFLETFQKENPEGGEAMAGCVIAVAPKREATLKEQP